MKKIFLIYLGLGLLISTYTAPMSWREVPNGELGNIPLWAFGYPVMFYCEFIKQTTGEYPSWTPVV